MLHIQQLSVLKDKLRCSQLLRRDDAIAFAGLVLIAELAGVDLHDSAHVNEITQARNAFVCR